MFYIRNKVIFGERTGAEYQDGHSNLGSDLACNLLVLKERRGVIRDVVKVLLEQ